MELVSFAKEVFQNVAEQVSSYRLGQSALRYVDKMLWVVEKAARWAVPPPLDQDDRPQPELVRPLPWPLFLMLLVVLRVTRESLSLVYLALGKPPIRSADVVTYIQSKRRYIRTLKYQGSRIMRTRAGASQAREPWYRSLQSLFEFTMCFRRQSYNYGNNNTTQLSNNEEILVVKRSKRGRQEASAVNASEDPMDRLIEKMMADLDADSDDDSSFTLTNVTMKSDTSVESDDETVYQKGASTMNKTQEEPETTLSTSLENNASPTEESPMNTQSMASSTPEKTEEKEDDNPVTPEKKQSPIETKQIEQSKQKTISPKELSKAFIQNEICATQNNPKSPKKIGNGQAIKTSPSKKKGGVRERRECKVPVVKITPVGEAVDGNKEMNRTYLQNNQ